MYDTGDDNPVLWWSTLQNRLRAQVVKYAERKMLIPIRFTGSLDDLRQLILRTTSPMGNRKSPSVERSPDLLSFSDDEYNEWCRAFQEYWLALVRSYEELGKLTENGSHRLVLRSTNSATKTDCKNVQSWYLSSDNVVFLRVAVEAMLNVFEKDRLPLTTNPAKEMGLVELLKKRLDGGNAYMAAQLLRRIDLVSQL